MYRRAQGQHIAPEGVKYRRCRGTVLEKTAECLVASMFHLIIIANAAVRTKVIEKQDILIAAGKSLSSEAIVAPQ